MEKEKDKVEKGKVLKGKGKVQKGKANVEQDQVEKGQAVKDEQQPYELNNFLTIDDDQGTIIQKGDVNDINYWFSLVGCNDTFWNHLVINTAKRQDERILERSLDTSLDNKVCLIVFSFNISFVSKLYCLIYFQVRGRKAKDISLDAYKKNKEKYIKSLISPIPIEKLKIFLFVFLCLGITRFANFEAYFNKSSSVNNPLGLDFVKYRISKKQFREIFMNLG